MKRSPLLLHRNIRGNWTAAEAEKKWLTIDDPSRIMYLQFTHLCKCILFKGYPRHFPCLKEGDLQAYRATR
jgi:hypothetical protein